MPTALASFDIAQRAAAAGLLLLVAALLARDHARSAAARLGAAFALGAAVFALASATPVVAADPPWRAPLMACSEGNNLVFWLFARTPHEDIEGVDRLVGDVLAALERPTAATWRSPRPEPVRG